MDSDDLVYRCHSRRATRGNHSSRKMIDALKKSSFKALAALGRTLYLWRDEIVRIWRFRKSNGITKGVHRKIKLIQRRAYGFRNFENYRIRVRVLCS